MVPNRRLFGITAALAICSALLAVSEQPAGAAVVADAGGPYAISEGDALLLDGSGSTGPATTWNWDLDNDGQYDDATGVSPLVSWATLFALGVDDDDAYTVGLEASDGITTATDTAVLTIANTAPTIAVTGASSAFASVNYNATISVNDPGADSAISWVINWGDGAITSGSGAPGTQAHTYLLGGFTRSVRVSVTDEDGTFSPDDVLVPFEGVTDKVGRYDMETGTLITYLDPASPVDSAYSAAMGPDGLLYVTSQDTHSVERYDPTDNSYIGTFVSTGSGGLTDPHGLAFGPDGNLYVVSNNTDEILRYHGTSGAFIDVFATGLSSAQTLAFGPGGDLYVVDAGGLGPVRRYDGTTGSYIGVFATPSAAPPEGLAWGPSGNLFVALIDDDEIEEFNGSTGASMGIFTSAGLSGPAAITFGPDGAMWVSNRTSDQITRHDATTGAFLGVRVSDSGSPQQLAFTASHQVAILDPLEVNSTGDASDSSAGDGACDTGSVVDGSPECTLRAAIEEANAAPAPSAIHFAIPIADSGYSASPMAWTITPVGGFDSLTSPVIIDARTQPGYAGDPVIELDGSGDALSTAALSIESTDSLIAGFAIHSFPDEGLEIDGGTNNTIINNWVGLDVSQTPIGNTDIGILIAGGGSGNTIGGTGTNDANYVGGNGRAGISVKGPNSNDNVVIGNVIGVAPDGLTSIPNIGHGVWIYEQPSLDNRIGGTMPGEGNVIANNTLAGVAVDADSGGGDGTGHSVLANSIHSNGGLGIDLGTDGFTLNDPGDGDSGANDLLNHPLITSAEAAEGNIKVRVGVDVGAGDYRLEFFANPSGADPSGWGEAEVLIGAVDITHNGTGTEVFTHTFAGAVGDVITATLTEDGPGGYGSTSELSNARTATASQLTITKTSDAGGATAPGATITYTIVATNAGPTPYTGVAIDDAVPVDTSFVSASVVQSTTQRARDNFDAVWYANDDGDPIWLGPWLEAGDDGTPAGGTFGINPDFPSGVQLALDAKRRSVTLDRPVDLTGSTFAELSFDYWIYHLRHNNEQVFIEVWDGAAWNTVATFDDTVPESVAWQPFVADITAFANAATQIRIRTGSNNTGAWGMNIDNLEVMTIGGPPLAGDPPPTVASGYTLAPGESLIVTYVVSVDATPSGSQIDNTGVLTSDRTPPQSDSTSDVMFQHDIDGQVFEDVNGNGDILDDGLPVDLVDVRLYSDQGNGEPDGSDTALPGTQTDPSGAWQFSGLSDGTYWITIDSTDVTPSAGYNIGFDVNDVWADQSYAAAGGASFNGAVWSFAGASGPFHGGAQANVPDAFASLGTAQHIMRVIVSGGDVSGVDTGFTFVSVNNTNDSTARQGSLRQAIDNANAIPGPPTFGFNIPTSDPGLSAGVYTINPDFALPEITEDLSLDASAQLGWVATPIVAVDGSTTGLADGLRLAAGASGSTIRGLSILNFQGDGLRVLTDSASILDNHIAANGGDAIEINGETADGNLIATTLVNVDLTELVAMPGAGAGVTVTGGADDTLIDSNVFGPSARGVDIAGLSSGSIIIGNYLGTDSTQAATHPFDEAAVQLSAGAFDNMIGGPLPSDTNVITNAGAVGPITDGVHIAADAGSGNSLLGNTVHDNAGLGINIDVASDPPNGVTNNDANDSDSGPNDVLNFPVITAAAALYGSIKIDFQLDAPAGLYRLEFFKNPSGADPSGNGEGESAAGFTSITHTGSGTESFTSSISGAAGDVVSATATDDLGAGLYGSTSEFSGVATVVGGGSPAFDSSIRRSDFLGAGGLDPSANVPGPVGMALDFDGGNDRLIGPAVDITTQALTMSGWVNLDALGTDPRVVAKTSAEGSTSYELLIDGGTAEAVARVRLSGTTYEARGGAVGVGVDTHLAGTWDGATLRVYVDGNPVNATAAAGTLSVDINREVIIGNVGNAARGLDGRIDEVRVETAARNAGWLATSHANQSNPAGFVNVGIVQTSVSQPWSVSGVETRSGSFALAAPETPPDADAWLTAVGIDEPGVEFTTWWWMSTTTLIDLAAGTRTGDTAIYQYETAVTSASGWDLGTQTGNSRSQDSAPAGSPSPGQWVRVVIRTDQLGNTAVIIDGTEVITATPQSGLGSSGSMGLRVGELPVSQQWYVDDARGRRLVTPEPTTSISSLDRN